MAKHTVKVTDIAALNGADRKLYMAAQGMFGLLARYEGHANARTPKQTFEILISALLTEMRRHFSDEGVQQVLRGYADTLDKPEEFDAHKAPSK